MKIDLYTQQGEKNGQVELPAEIFEVPFNKDLVHQALMRQLSNRRVAIAHTKTKGEVRGGGRKPFRQKGTGNARQGSIRSPHMRGGGVVFGPRSNRNFVKDMPKKQRRRALFSALSEKARQEEVIALEEYKAEKPNTKEFATMIGKLPIDRNVLVVIDSKNEIIQKSASNLPNVKVILAGYVNIHDLQRHKRVLITKAGIEKLSEIFITKK